MEFSFPEFPGEPYAQYAFLAACFLTLFGLALLIVPGYCRHVWGLDEHERRPGGLGELRVAGGFLAGLGLSCLMLEQPVIYVTFGVALAFGAFGRVLSMMSDQAATLTNFGLWLLQVLLAWAMLTYLFEVWTPDSTFVMPEDLAGKIVAVVYLVLMVFGFLTLFAPRVALGTGGLMLSMSRRGGEAAVRSQGGIALGAGLVGLLLANPLVDLALGAALLLSAFGRVLALLINRGRPVFGATALFVQLALSLILLAHVFGYF
jgi:hypothetical protein